MKDNFDAPLEGVSFYNPNAQRCPKCEKESLHFETQLNFTEAPAPPTMATVWVCHNQDCDYETPATKEEVNND